MTQEVPDWLSDAFSALDRKDTAGWLKHADYRFRFRFAEGALCETPPQIEETFRLFFAAVKSLSHRVERLWNVGETVMAEGVGTFTRLDGKAVEVHFMTVVTRKEAKIVEWMTYLDPMPIFEA